jgi:hypothetical protein
VRCAECSYADRRCVKCHYAECHYGECQYAPCCARLNIVFIQTVIVLITTELSVFTHTVIALNVLMLSVIIQTTLMLSVILQIDVTLIVVASTWSRRDAQNS